MGTRVALIEGAPLHAMPLLSYSAAWSRNVADPKAFHLGECTGVGNGGEAKQDQGDRADQKKRAASYAC